MFILPAESTLVAHEAALRLWIFTRLQPIQNIFVLIDRDAATRTAVGADTVLRLQPPDALLIQEIFTAQRAHRTKVDHIAGQFVIARFTGKDVDLFMRSTADDLHFRRAADLARETD